MARACEDARRRPVLGDGRKLRQYFRDPRAPRHSHHLARPAALAMPGQRAVAGCQKLRAHAIGPGTELYRTLRFVLHALDLVLSRQDATEDRPDAGAPASGPAR